MQWSDYKKISSGIYAPEASKPTSTRSKLIVAEGLSSKNLLRMPGKLSAPQVSMESDLRKFISGKPILNEVAPLIAAAIPAAVELAAPAAVGAATGAATGAAATGTAGAVGGAVAGETAAAGAASAGEVAASSLAAEPVTTALAAAPESGTAVAQQATQSSTSKAMDFAKDVASNTTVDTNPQQTSHPNDQEEQ